MVEGKEDTHVFDEVEEEGDHASHVVEVVHVLFFHVLDGKGVVVHALPARRHLPTVSSSLLSSSTSSSLSLIATTHKQHYPFHYHYSQ